MWAMHGAQLLGGLAAVALSWRILGPEGYGALALFMACTTLVGGLLYLPGDQMIATYVTKNLAQGQRREAGNALRFALGAALVSKLAAYGAVVAATLGFGKAIGIEPEHVAAMLVYASVLVTGAMQNECLAILRLAHRVPIGFAATAASALVQVGGLAAAWWVNGGILAVALAYAGCMSAYGGILFIGAVRAARQAKLPLSLRPLLFRMPREVVGFQAAAFVNASCRALNLCLDVVAMAQLTTLAQVGIYRAARQIADFVLRPFFPLALGVQAEYSRLWYGAKRTALRRLALRSSLLSLALSAGGCGLLGAFHPWIIPAILGAGFAEVAASLLIMLIGLFAMAASMALHGLPAATGRGWPGTVIGMAALAVQVAAIALLAPKYGAVGAAWAYTGYCLVFVAFILPCAMAVLRKPAAGDHAGR